MPAIHAGYLKFIKRTDIKDVFIIDDDLAVNLIPRLERDIRALKADEVVPLLKGLVKNRNFTTLKKNNVENVADSYTGIVMPSEDISKEIAKKYFSKNDIEYVDTFLRWDMSSSIKASTPKSDYEITNSQANKKFMDMAVLESQQSSDWWRQVGSVIIKDGKVLLKAHNHSSPSKNYSVEVFGDPRSNFDAGQNIELSKFIHAEAYLISLAAKQGLSLDGTSIFVSTFPCPVCSKLIVNAGISEVYFKDGYSLLDAEDIFKAKNIKIVRVV
jgi:dCMP deaminase